jgi:hypothetical protein
VLLLGAVILVDGVAGLARWLPCLGVLRGRTSPSRPLSFVMSTDPFCGAGGGWGRLPLGCFDWKMGALTKLGGGDIVVLAFDHGGLFLNGDLVLTALPLESVAASCNLVACCVCLAGVVCLTVLDFNGVA